jgi:hypothetical protein
MQFHICLCAELDSQWPVTESVRIQTATATKHIQNKTLKHEFLQISLDLQTALAAEAHRAEGATKRRDVTNVPRMNMNADCFEDKGATFSATRHIY